MANAGASIEAVLTLNSTGFQQGITKSITALDKFVTSISKLKNTDGRLAIQNLTTALLEFDTVLRQVELMSKSSINTFSKLSSAVNKMANGLKLLQGDELNIVEAVNTMNNVFKAFQGVLEGTEVKVKELKIANDTLVASERQVATASVQESASIEKDAVSKDKATVSTNKYANANKGLSKTFGMLRNGLTVVGSMLAYNFIHNLGVATTETINAKSEMEGYFKMLHFSQSDINQFNTKLDETVSKFQRINKYALGETISSIGVEFNLTTKEMEKAMPVVSMITSEYLRAGRNVNEASLAVKDILQGEFQRLSRETGVKGEQLKEAGWSGDKTDVMGLLEALDKVGKSRNWDIFVTKANSLNDAVLILQNRFSEWSADMVNVVQPTILAVFNNLMAFGQGASQSLSGMWKWLNTDSWGATATKIGLVSTAVLTLMPSLVSLRSGAKLLEVANMGVTQSLGALIFGLNAETLATHTSSEAIAMRILGIQAEELENTTLVGLINGMIVSRNAETIATDLATASNLGFTGGLTAMITGEAIAEGTTISLTGALGLLTGAFLTSPIGWFTLAILGLASAFYVLTGGLSDSWEKMHQFNETMKDTGSAQKEANEWLESVKKKAGEDSQAFKDAKDSVDNYTHSLQSASYWYNQSQTAFQGLDLTRQTTSKDILKKYGVSKKDADEWNANLDTLSFGKQKYYKAEQVLNKQLQGENSNFAKDLDDYLGKVKKNGGDLEEAYDKMAGNYDALAYHSYVANTTDSWWEWLWNSFYAGMDQFWIDWDKFWADPQWGDAIDGIKKIFGGGDNELGVGAVGSIANLLGIDANGSEIIKMWDDFWTGVFEGIGDWQKGAVDWLQPLNDFGDEVNKFLADPLGYLNIDLSGFNIWSIFGLDTVSASDGSSDHPSFMEDVSSILGFDVQSWIDSFNADPLGTLGISLPNIDIIGMIKSLIPMDSGGFNLGDWLKDIFNIDGIINYFTTNLPTIVNTVTSTASTVSGLFSGLKSTIQGHLTGIVTNVSTGFENAKNYAVTKITAMRDSTSNVIHQMTDAWVHMKDSILNSAKLIYDGVKQKFDSVGNTLKDFFTKLQNPSQWGAGQRSMSRTPRPATARRLFGGFSGGKHGAGINPYTSPNQKVRLEDLIDAVGGDKRVTLSDFLSMFTDGGFGSWSFHNATKNHIFSKGKEWKSAPANIQGIGSVGNGYKVARFWDGKPNFSFDEFLTVAEAIFSAIPYKFYYDSEWKGSWVNALLSGAVNCSDGADALLALASVFGFSGEKVHTNLANGTGHFYAVINGKTMDTTNFQNRGSWGKLGGAGSPPRGAGASTSNTTINITLTGDVYGMDDFESKMREASRRVMREEFNDPYTIAL